MARKYKKYRLKEDIVIPAGTEFEEVPPGSTRHYNTGFADTVLGLTKDNCGYVVIDVESNKLEEVTDGN